MSEPKFLLHPAVPTDAWAIFSTAWDMAVTACRRREMQDRPCAGECTCAPSADYPVQPPTKLPVNPYIVDRIRECETIEAAQTLLDAYARAAVVLNADPNPPTNAAYWKRRALKAEAKDKPIAVGVDATQDGCHVVVRQGDTVVYSRAHQINRQPVNALMKQVKESLEAILAGYGREYVEMDALIIKTIAAIEAYQKGEGQ